MAVLPVLYLLAMVSLLVVALRLMWFNVNQINKLLNNQVEVNPRLQHPELENVKNGDELMVVKFKPEIDAEGMLDIKFTPDDEFSDRFLRKSLNERLDELEDDEDDDDGDVPAVVRR
tara:strand:+ start:376 stop:726 length:351 start_codon:yes stop_codon:yes gene_type:complete